MCLESRNSSMWNKFFVHQEVFCPPKLLCAATHLIHAVWKERKVTAMAAMGRRYHLVYLLLCWWYFCSDGFWKHLLQPLFCDVDLEPSREVRGIHLHNMHNTHRDTHMCMCTHTHIPPAYNQIICYILYIAGNCPWAWNMCPHNQNSCSRGI